tara:strand:- start:44 stop:463 length:420 start_codon:yes stop_codon:yes gene_type:complete
MPNPESRSAILPFRWLGAYGLAFSIPVLLMAIALMEHESVFVGLSACLALLVGYQAWRSARGRIGLVWRGALAGVMLVMWAFGLALIYAPPGEAGICYDRFIKQRPWGPIENLGPDPYCKGVPIEAVWLENQRRAQAGK